MGISEKEFIDGYKLLLFYPVKKYSHLLHSGQWGDKKIDNYQTWAIEALPIAIKTYNRARGMKFTSFVLWIARRHMQYKFKIQDRQEEAEKMFSEGNPYLLEEKAQKTPLKSLSEENKKFVELRFGLNGKEKHTWKEMCIIYNIKHTYSLRRRMEIILKKLRKKINYEKQDCNYSRTG